MADSARVYASLCIFAHGGGVFGLNIFYSEEKGYLREGAGRARWGNAKNIDLKYYTSLRCHS